MPAVRPMRPLWTIWTFASFSLFSALVECRAAELNVGGATISITPDRPVALAGQMHTRIARTVLTEFGIQIKARSRALQTFIIQLAGPGSYVPTGRADRGGG